MTDIRRLACVSLLCLGLGELVRAADPPDEKPTAEKPPAEQADKPAAPKRKPRKSLEEQFREALGGKPAEQAQDQAGDSVNQIVERMRQVQGRIAEADAGTETRESQAKIVSDIDRLIELLKQQPPPQQSPPPSAGDPPPMGNPPPMPMPKPMPAGQAEQRPQGEGAEQPMTTESASDKAARLARESEEKIRQSQGARPDDPRKQDWNKDVWGNLPPSVRQQLLNQFSEKFVPKYDELVRRYYEALAEDYNRK